MFEGVERSELERGGKGQLRSSRGKSKPLLRELREVAGVGVDGEKGSCLRPSTKDLEAQALPPKSQAKLDYYQTVFDEEFQWHSQGGDEL